MAEKTIWFYINYKSLFLPSSCTSSGSRDHCPCATRDAQQKQRGVAADPRSPCGMRLPRALPPLQPLVFSPGLCLKGAVHSRLAEEWLISVSTEGVCLCKQAKHWTCRLDPQICNFMVKDHSLFTSCGVRKEHKSRACPRLKDG